MQLLPCAFETPIQLFSHKTLGRIKPAPEHPGQALPTVHRSQAPSAPTRHNKLCSQIPNSNSSWLSPLQSSRALCGTNSAPKYSLD